MFGPVTDLYKNRLHAEYDQLSYSEDDYVVYPDIICRNWMWHQPIGGSGSYSGPDFPSATGISTAQKVQFNIANNNFTDPASYRLYCVCTTGVYGQTPSTNTGVNGQWCLSNYAHSMINQLTVRFTGTSSTVVEQVTNYNIFSSMWYQFYTTNYVQKIQASLEGFNTTGASRKWNGRSFMLPLNVGFFLTTRKYLPNIVLPIIQIEFLMERNAVAMYAYAPATATAGSTASNGTGYYYITVPMLVTKEITVNPEKIDNLRREIAERQQEGNPIRLDFTSWTGLTFNVAASVGGLSRTLITGNFVGIRKVMFAMLNTTPSITNTSGTETVGVSDTAPNIDQINSFTLGGWTSPTNTSNVPLGNTGLQSYRIQIGGRYFPDQEIYVNGTNASTQVASDSSLAYFMNIDSVGSNYNGWADIYQSWEITNSGTDITNASNTNWVFLLSTEFDDAGLPVKADMINSGPLSILQRFAANTPAVNLTTYVFVNYNRCIHIYEGNRCEVIDG